MRNDKQIKMLPVHPYGKTLCRVHGGRRQGDWGKDVLQYTQFKYGVPFRNRIIREKTCKPMQGGRRTNIGGG